MARNDEARLQRAVIDFVCVVAPEKIALIFHVANGEWRDARTAAKLKWMGVVPGIPDLVLVKPGGQMAFWEIKLPGGQLSEAQKRIQEICQKYNIPHYIIHGIDQARCALADFRVSTREHKHNGLFVVSAA